MSPESVLSDVVSVMVTVVEACGAVIITYGALWAFVRLILIAFHTRDSATFVPVRLTLGRFLSLGLEFQLAADVLRTAVAPSFKEIGQLAAIAAIRTARNFFLGMEIREERELVRTDQATARQQRKPDEPA
jgi:uncharacterized membrane protein